MSNETKSQNKGNKNQPAPTPTHDIVAMLSRLSAEEIEQYIAQRRTADQNKAQAARSKIAAGLLVLSADAGFEPVVVPAVPAEGDKPAQPESKRVSREFLNALVSASGLSVKLVETKASGATGTGRRGRAKSQETIDAEKKVLAYIKTQEENKKANKQYVDSPRIISKETGIDYTRVMQIRTALKTGKLTLNQYDNAA